MPVLIDEISAEVEPQQNQRSSEAQDQAETMPSQQRQLDALRRKLRQIEQRKMRLRAD